MSWGADKRSAFDYAARLTEMGGVRETRLIYPPGEHWNERHLQCVWFDASLRPPALLTDEGESVRVEFPGHWNLEAGPDFLDARLCIGREQRRLMGDVEVHVRPVDWKRHAHGRDPRYAHVIAHVTYYPGKSSDLSLPAGTVSIVLRDALLGRPGFSFADIDLAAYPHAYIPSTPRPCALALGNDPDRRAALLTAAGRYRMTRKRQALAERIERQGDARQTLYEFFMAGLGYKHNAVAMRRLARCLPLRDWPGGMAPEVHYARLLGSAGLLPSPDLAEDAITERLLRSLWDLWWRHPAPEPEPPLSWHLGTLRPYNHPARRLAAAAAWFGGETPIESLWGEPFRQGTASDWRRLCRRLMQGATMDCWRRRRTLLGPEGDRGGALLGAARAGAIVNNTIAPHIANRMHAPEEFFDALPPESISAPMRSTATHLFGRDHNPALYSGSGLLQQGLLQIHADFCLNANVDCVHCVLPARLGA